MSEAGKKLGLGKKSGMKAKESPNPKAKGGKPKSEAIAAHSFPREETHTDKRENNSAADNLWSNNKVTGTTSSGGHTNKTRIFGSASK